MRVLICDDHKLFAEALGHYLSCRGHEVVCWTNAGVGVIDMLRAEKPDVLLIDVQFASGSGLAVAAELRATGLATRVIVSTGHVDAQILAALRDGLVHDILVESHPLSEVERAMHSQSPSYAVNRAVDRPAPGRVPTPTLTGRERQIMDLLAKGVSTEAICHELEIAPSTVHTHVQSVLRKLGVTSRLQAVSAYLAATRGGSLPLSLEDRHVC